MIKPLEAVALLCLCWLGVHAEVINIDNAELARLAASGAAVIDIRTPPEWKETGVISGSKLLTFFDEKGRVDAPAWIGQLKSLTKPGQAVVLICRSGNRSLTAAQFLAQQPGYKTVYNATGGLNVWSREGRSVVPQNSATVMCAVGAVC
jgi:rhodanese-related sulfurtransferase